MAPPRYRGTINNGFQLSIAIGVLAANLVNYGTDKISAGWGWRVSLSLGAVPAFILTLSAFFLPETPISLIQLASDPSAAELMLRRVRGTDDVAAEFSDLLAASNTAKATKQPFRRILARKYRPQLVVAIVVPFFQQVTGINVIGLYAPILFQTIGLGVSTSLLTTIATASVVGALSTFISMVVVDRVGRRMLFFVGGVQMAAAMAVVGGVMAAELGDRGGIGRGAAATVLVMIPVYVSGFSWSWGPLGWLVPSEVFPLEIRSAGMSVTVVVNFVFTFAVAQTFLAMLCHFKAGIFFFFGGWVVVMTGFVYWFLPETKGVPIEKMDLVWRDHWFWTRFVVGPHDCEDDEIVPLTLC